MAAKKAKLDKQFNTSTRVITSKDEAASNQSEIFKGLSVYINGYTGNVLIMTIREFLTSTCLNEIDAYYPI